MGLILPPGVVLGDADEPPAERPGPPCAVCGEAMPAFTDEQWAELERLSRVRRVVLKHDVCPRDAARPQRERRFEARVAIVEVTLEPGATDATSTELAGFTAYTDADNLEEAMRPLAVALGAKWLEVEEKAHIADPSDDVRKIEGCPSCGKVGGGELDADDRCSLCRASAVAGIDPAPVEAETAIRVLNPHRCGAGEADYPPEGIVCLCSTGRDHTEAEFDQGTKGQQ
jgi:hypothetical protein